MSETPFDDRLRRDPVLLVVGELDGAAAVRLVERALDRLRQLVRVEQHLAVDVPRGAADRLDQRRLAAQEALLVRVEDRDERHLGQVEALAQQVDADEHVVLAEPQLADDLDPLERVDLGVQVARPDARLEQVVGQVLGHLLRQRRHEHALAGLLAPADLVEQVVDLVLRRAQLDLRVDDPGRADRAARRRASNGAARRRPASRRRTRAAAPSPGTRRSGAAGCRAPTAAGSRSRRASACASGRPRTCRRSAAPSGATRPRRRRSPAGSSRAARTGASPAAAPRGCASSSRSRGRSSSSFSISRSYSVRCLIRCASSIRPSSSKRAHLRRELGADLVDGALDRRLRRHVLGRRPDRDVVELRVDLAGDRVEVRDLLDLVAEERDAVGGLLVRRLDLDDVALDPEAPAAEHRVVADVLAVDQLPQRRVAVVLLPHLEDQHPLAPLLGRAEAVDARDRRDDDHVAPREQRRGRVEPQPRDVVVLRGVLLDVEVGLRDVGLGLVVVVVGDEVLDRVVGEELAELVAELRRQRLVVRDHERRLLHLLHDPGHRRRLPGAGRAEQRLVALAGVEPLGDRLDRPRLVAGGAVLVSGLELAASSLG